jgi:hypothetical protein
VGAIEEPPAIGLLPALDHVPGFTHAWIRLDPSALK